MSVSFALAFLAGLASFLSPCVLPLVPSYITFVTGMTLDDFRADELGIVRGKAAMHAGLFILGFSLLFIALGASASAFGTVLRRLLPVMQEIGGVVIIIFGLYMLNVIRPRFLMRERRVQLSSKPAGMAGSVIAGVAFGAGWTPCIGPVLASILVLASNTQSLARGMALLAVYSIGLGLPFFIAAVGFNAWLQRAAYLRRWLLPIERVAGAMLLVLGLLLLTGRFNALSRFFAGFGDVLVVR